ncbi:GIY-YIG nuclease family protein [Clostridium perfringens]|nr:GIY-YIG nuclease family protein [Clostridium perfringens]MDK0982938.1 GIY-YIG nuclease family protein [Clostridium perfringens]
MESLSKLEIFIDKANKKHNNKFDYSKFVYKTAKTKSIIICPIHGEFLQNPDKHLNSKYGCIKCANKKRIKTREDNGWKPQNDIKSKEYFLKLANKKFGSKFKYDLSNYNGMTGNDIKIYCEEHGVFEKIPHNFLVTNYGCTKCGIKNRSLKKTKDYENFLFNARKIHKDKYEYLEENRTTYKNRKSIVKIYCKEHKVVFNKMAQKHLSGQGCFKCKIDELVSSGILAGDYSFRFFKENPNRKNDKAYLYYFSFSNTNYFKIGITTNIRKRMNSLKSEIKRNDFGDIENLRFIETNLFNAYKKEQKILNHFKKFRTRLNFSTEIFDTDISNLPEFDTLFNL